MGGGGHVEEALVDLTGGVAGRFYTADVWGPWGWCKGHPKKADLLMPICPTSISKKIHDRSGVILLVLRFVVVFEIVVS